MEENIFLNQKSINDNTQHVVIYIGEDIPGFKTSEITLQYNFKIMRDLISDADFFREVFTKQILSQTIEDKCELTKEEVIVMKFHITRIVNQFMQHITLQNNFQ